MEAIEVDYMSAAEAAEYLRVSLSYLRKLTSARKIPFYKLGKRRLYSKDELRAWADRKRVPTVKEQVQERVGA